MYKIKLKKTVITINHDRLQLCKDRDISSWLTRCDHRILEGENIILPIGRDLHCLCRKPDDGKLMIQCDYCDEWYHGACINITPEQADMLVKFRCPRCKYPESAGTI